MDQRKMDNVLFACGALQFLQGEKVRSNFSKQETVIRRNKSWFTAKYREYPGDFHHGLEFLQKGLKVYFRQWSLDEFS